MERNGSARQLENGDKVELVVAIVVAIVAIDVFNGC